MAPSAIRRFFDPAGNFQRGRGKLFGGDGANEKLLAGEFVPEEPGCDALAAYSIIAGLPERTRAADETLRRLREIAAGAHIDKDLQMQDRSLGCMLGNVVGDALGAPLEFSPVRYDVPELKGMDHTEIWQKDGYNSFNLKPGQWTDDGSMALCILDSLLCCNGFNAYDIRQRFHAWNSHGYCNAFGRDTRRKGRGSVGLGGNISASMGEWERNGTAATTSGDRFTSGNGSLMRNGAVAVWFREDVDAGMAAACGQSRTTHAGDEAAELCRLLTFICTRFINGAGRELLDDLSSFETHLYNVRCLANARCEEKHEHNSDPVFGGLERRKWDWRSPGHRYCEFRAEENPGYIGSYAMDALSMSLHCVYSTQSFTEATLKAANLRGDADTVCAITAQMAGALYGSSAIPESWLALVRKWDGGTIAARALMAYHHEHVGPDIALGDAACESAALLATSWKKADTLRQSRVDQRDGESAPPAKEARLHIEEV
eukprot:TRINITY_DN105010_c0_g1_i1.p1 TRINITY_DN105010_c0_g1~~TRINITY_DN105010_c0_g1_i1.p1  ORF type:complete len:512 (+),score=76.33 TRINITY_DN105010_c0_g1_i1:76-1536(+)